MSTVRVIRYIDFLAVRTGLSKFTALLFSGRRQGPLNKQIKILDVDFQSYMYR